MDFQAEQANLAHKTNRANAGAPAVAGPSLLGSALAGFGLLITGLTMPQSLPSSTASYAAFGTFASLGLLFGMELRRGLRNLLNADLLMIAALYYLTLAEFLVDQPRINSLLSSETAFEATWACLLGILGLVLGRHQNFRISKKIRFAVNQPVKPHRIFQILCLVFFGGFFYMFSTVDFDIIRFVSEAMGPRFTQSWTRPQYGDWESLLFETNMLLYLVPPAAGIIVGRMRTYGVMVIAATFCMLAFSMFYAVTTGTRNMFAAFLLTFLVSYVLMTPERRKISIVLAASAALGLLVLSTEFILESRNIGLSAALDTPEEMRPARDDFFVDYNLWAIGVAIDNIPAHYDYMYFEIPIVALVRPVPRVIWPSKPTDLSFSLEEAAGVYGNMTMSSTFVGEAYESFGYLGVILLGFLFGGVGRWWTIQAADAGTELGFLVYAAGLFSLVLGMRSVTYIVPGLLPAIAAIIAFSLLRRFWKSRLR